MTEKKYSGLRAALPSLIAILFGLIVGVGIIYLTNPSVAGEAIPQFLVGPFTNGLGDIGNLFYFATPLLMTGLAVAFAFQTGMFNIGASGQFLLGGFLAVLVAAKLKDIIPHSVIWIVCILAAACGGAFLGGLVGLLKAYRNVNEVIACIMLNYITMYVVNDFIKRFGLYNTLKGTSISIDAEVPKMGIDLLFPGTFAGGGILIAVAISIVLWVILRRTVFGFEIRGVGLNRNAARYAGINEKHGIILSMMFSGILAAIGGALVYLSGAGNQISMEYVLPSEGFDGIAVALLGLSNPLGVILSALFFAYMKLGGQAIQTLGFEPELVTIITAFILYVSALSVLFQRLLHRRKKNPFLSKVVAETGNGSVSPHDESVGPDGAAVSRADRANDANGMEA